MIWTLLWLWGCGAKAAPPEALPAIDPADGIAVQQELAESLVESGEADAALLLVGQLREAGVRSADLDVLHASALRQAGLTGLAEDKIDGVVDRHPRIAAAHAERGLLHMERGAPDAAAASFAQAARLERDEADHLNNLGFALLAAGRADEAVDPLLEALDLDTSLRVRTNLGLALAAAGRSDEALEVFGSVHDTDQALYLVAVGVELGGDTTEALAAYQAAATRFPDHAAAQRALARLSANEEVP